MCNSFYPVSLKISQKREINRLFFYDVFNLKGNYLAAPNLLKKRNNSLGGFENKGCLQI